jgi:hypothetical protein
MKKILYSILALAGVVATSCTQEHIDVQYIPDNVVAPVLGTIEGCELYEGENITVEYTKADFGVTTSAAQNLYVAATEDMADMKKAKATFNDNTIVLAHADLNIVALEFGTPGEATDLYFAIVANLNTDKGNAVAGTETMSNVVKATFKSYVADVLPTEKFEKVWVIGDYCGWGHDKTQFLFDYTSSGTTFAGVVDFNKDGASAAANGFKLTGVAGWDDTCNWGLEDNTTAESEAASLQLITGGGSQDIKCYAKRFYGFEFDNTTLVLKKTWGADQIGIIGLNGDWENDIVMEYNAKWTRFYADIDVAAATEMKFRADAAWNLNWGVDCVQGGDNIAVEAGKYRVYFNPATGLIEFNARNYGTTEDTGANAEPEQPVEPEQPAQEAGKWGLIGVAGDWNNDIYMYAGDGGKFYSPIVTFEGEFKLRFNNGWDINRGGVFAAAGEAFAAEAGGANISVPAGTYSVVYDSVAETVTVVDALVGWGLIGDGLAKGWDADTYKAFEGEAGVFTAIAYVGEGSFKLRANAGWDTNFGGDFVAFGEPFTAAPGGNNISLGESNIWVVVVLDTNASTITVNKLFANRWGVIGNVNGTSWNADVFMWNDGGVWKSVPFVANGAFKIRKDAGWDVNRGGVFAAFDTAFAAEAGGADINAGTDVLVTVAYDSAAETITVSEFK